MARGQPWWPQAQVTVDVLMQELGDDLAGVYVHGSTALGGWVSTSDLDVLAVVEDTAHTNWHALGSRILTGALAGPVLEMSVVTTRSSMHPTAPWPFLVHVAQG